MKDIPLVSVLMPVYNAENFIAEAIESILAQTYSDFEFIIIDDSSTDRSVEIINSYKDSRIILIVKPKNTGYTQSLNIGLSLAKGKYIARMDSDDVSLPVRFAKQVNVLESDLKIGVCGSSYNIIGSKNVKVHPFSHDEIQVAMLTHCAIGHPTVMLRKSVLDLNDIKYDPSFEPAEDYCLWVKLSRYTKLVNIQEVLLNYRVHETQVSGIKRSQQLKNSDKVILQQLQNFKVTPSDDEQRIHLTLANANMQEIIKLTVKETFIWLNGLYKANRRHHNYNEFYLRCLLQDLWHNFLFSKLEYNLSTLKFDVFSEFSVREKLGGYNYIKFVVKCLIKYKN